MEDTFIRARLNMLAQSKYAMPMFPENEWEKGVKNRKQRVLNALLLGGIIAIFSTMCIALSAHVCRQTGFNNVVNSENIGDYLSIFATHCSIVFLTTSLMTMLSEKSKYVYHIDLVEFVLINPVGCNFLALVVYALASVAIAMFGFGLKKGPLIIGGFLFGIIAIVVLFWRMIMIYYNRAHHKNEIRKFLHDLVVLVREMEDKKITRKYVEEMEKIGYERQFRKVLDRAWVELKNDNTSFVFEVIELFEELIMWHVKDTYEKDSQKVDNVYKIVSSNISTKRSYNAPTRLYIEYYYLDLVSMVAAKYPDKVIEYYNSARRVSECRYLKMIQSVIVTQILNDCVKNKNKQEFFQIFAKWESKMFFDCALKNILDFCIEKDKIDYWADYYKYMAYSKAGNIEIADAGLGVLVSSSNEKEREVFLAHAKVLREMYSVSVETFEKILSYSDTRERIMQYFSYDLDRDCYCIEENLELIVDLAETSVTNEEPSCFLARVRKWIIDLLRTEDEEIINRMSNLLNYIINLKGVAVKKTNEDVEYLLSHLLKEMCSNEVKQWLYYYDKKLITEDFEEIDKVTRKYYTSFFKTYKQSIKQGILGLEEIQKSYDEMGYCEEDNSRNCKMRIELLQKHLAEVELMNNH